MKYSTNLSIILNEHLKFCKQRARDAFPCGGTMSKGETEILPSKLCQIRLSTVIFSRGVLEMRHLQAATTSGAETGTFKRLFAAYIKTVSAQVSRCRRLTASYLCIPVPDLPGLRSCSHRSQTGKCPVSAAG